MSQAPFLELPRLLVFSPLGLLLKDEFTGGAPLGFVRPILEVEGLAGTWTDTKVRGLFTDSGILAYPNLGRRGKLPNAAEPPRNYRVKLATQYYIPFYEPWPTAEGFAFSVSPYTGDTEPKTLIAKRGTLRLLPGPNYPFPGFAKVRYGVVLGAVSNKPIPGALVEAFEPIDDTTPISTVPTSRVLAGLDVGFDAGAYRLPLRWGDPKTTQKTTVRATDPQTSIQSALLEVPFPYVLTKPVTITIPTL